MSFGSLPRQRAVFVLVAAVAPAELSMRFNPYGGRTNRPVHKAAHDRVVGTVLKGIWDNIDKLPPLHP